MNRAINCRGSLRRSMRKGSSLRRADSITSSEQQQGIAVSIFIDLYKIKYEHKPSPSATVLMSIPMLEKGLIILLLFKNTTATMMTVNLKFHLHIIKANGIGP